MKIEEKKVRFFKYISVAFILFLIVSFLILSNVFTQQLDLPFIFYINSIFIYLTHMEVLRHNALVNSIYVFNDIHTLGHNVHVFRMFPNLERQHS